MYFDQERIKRILKELQGNIYPNREPVKTVFMKQGDFLSPGQAEKQEGKWTHFDEDDRWGGKDQRCWFRSEIFIPQSFEGKTVVFQIRTGREGGGDATNPQFLIYLNGKAVQGLDINHREIVIGENVKAGEKFVVDLHAYAGMQEGKVEFRAQIAVRDCITEKIYYDIKVPLEAAILLSKEDKRRIDTLNLLNNAVNLLDLRKPHSAEYYLSLQEADRYLKEEFYGAYCGHESVTAVCVGHTHIDVAWLWTLKQTREKVARSFSTVLNMMKEYSGYIFMSSQPQLYKFLKEDHPEIYEELKERVKEGRWEAEGGMWLEADCNISSGEALIRQILYGTRFFKTEFGVENKILWLPDVFGYSAALPQILNKFGIRYFMTTKISWNEYNKLPYDTFMWEGLDGSSVLTYFITTAEYEKVLTGSRQTTYVGILNPSHVMGAWERYQQKGINDEVFICYGYGDGGGGPTREMLENAMRMEKGIPGCPRVELATAREFFERMEAQVCGSKRLPKWVGELYLEYHRGTYTTMARNKRYNRKSEFLFQDIEFFNILNLYLNNGVLYPEEEIRKGWEVILLNQFHDIIPGSSIKEVYDESREQYEILVKNGNTLLQKALNQLSGNIGLNEKSLVVFNQLGFDRSDVITFEIQEDKANIELVDRDGNVYPVQFIGRGQAIAFVENIPAKGYKSFAIRKSDKQVETQIRATAQDIHTRYFDIKLDSHGNITSIYDKIGGREVLQSGSRANVLQAFEDKPHNYDAWDINIYYREKMWEVNDVEEIRVTDCGPVRATIEIRKKFLDSVIIQYMHVYQRFPRIDFENEIEWKEKQILLKAAFPVDVHTDKATYEIQYGNIERPTHWNTSWDMAKFEVCAHKWADLSEDGYGVSLLNDCKYGYDIKDAVMRLTLLKSPTWPNPEADKEIHRFTYSLYPHREDWRDGRTIQTAYALNCPMYTKVEEAHGGRLPVELCFVRSDQENVIVEVVKKAEDNDDSILRVYECYNRRSKVTLNFFKELKYARETDLNEAETSIPETDGTCLSFEIRPYEIRTFKVKL